MITKSIKQRIKDFFFQFPTKKIRVRQLSRELGVPLPSVIRYLHELGDEEMVKLTTLAEVKLYSANRASSKFRLEKMLFNIKRLYDSGLIDYLTTHCHFPVIVVFGSFRRGEDVEDSDIDIYIETQVEVGGLRTFEDKLHRELQIFRYSSLKDVKNKELANNILNGITLEGYIEVFKCKIPAGRVALKTVRPKREDSTNSRQFPLSKQQGTDSNI